MQNASALKFSLNFYLGWGLKQDEYEGVLWFKKAAQRGSAEGAARYANCLQHGFGIKMDVELGKVI